MKLDSGGVLVESRLARSVLAFVDCGTALDNDPGLRRARRSKPKCRAGHLENLFGFDRLDV